jgi:hypothetical protein
MEKRKRIVLAIELTEDEKKILKDKADLLRLKLATYCRMILLKHV